MGLQQFSEKRESSEVEGLEEGTVWKDVSLQLALMDGEKEEKEESIPFSGEQYKQRHSQRFYGSVIAWSSCGVEVLGWKEWS